jgi:hypothetical protein
MLRHGVCHECAAIALWGMYKPLGPFVRCCLSRCTRVTLCLSVVERVLLLVRQKQHVRRAACDEQRYNPGLSWGADGDFSNDRCEVWFLERQPSIVMLPRGTKRLSSGNGMLMIRSRFVFKF